MSKANSCTCNYIICIYVQQRYMYMYYIYNIFAYSCNFVAKIFVTIYLSKLSENAKVYNDVETSFSYTSVSLKMHIQKLKRTIIKQGNTYIKKWGIFSS